MGCNWYYSQILCMLCHRFQDGYRRWESRMPTPHQNRLVCTVANPHRRHSRNGTNNKPPVVLAKQVTNGPLGFTTSSSSSSVIEFAPAGQGPAAATHVSSSAPSRSFKRNESPVCAGPEEEAMMPEKNKVALDTDNTAVVNPIIPSTTAFTHQNLFPLRVLITIEYSLILAFSVLFESSQSSCVSFCILFV